MLVGRLFWSSCCVMGLMLELSVAWWNSLLELLFSSGGLCFGFAWNEFVFDLELTLVLKTNTTGGVYFAGVMI